MSKTDKLYLLQEVEQMAWRCSYEHDHEEGELRALWLNGYKAMIELYKHLADEGTILKLAYEKAKEESCTTDCAAYRMGTCPYRYNMKLHCQRVKDEYLRRKESQLII